MANEPIREVVVNGNTYQIEADTSALEQQIQDIDNDKVDHFTSGNYAPVTGLAYDSTNKKLGLKVNGADTVIPFKSTTVMHLGTGTSFNLKTLGIDGYEDFTSDNFLVVLNSLSCSSYNNYNGLSKTSGSSSSRVSKSYDSSTGVLTVSGVSNSHSMYNTVGLAGGSCSANVDVYLVIGDIESVN